MIDENYIEDAAMVIGLLPQAERMKMFEHFAEKFKSIPGFNKDRFRATCYMEPPHCRVCGMILTSTEVERNMCFSCRATINV